MTEHRSLSLQSALRFRLVRVGVLVLLTATIMSAMAATARAPALAAGGGQSSAADLCVKKAAKAGFVDGALVTAVAVGLAESGCSREARHANGRTRGCRHGSTDRGLWQINNCYHSEVSDRCAYDSQCNADAAYAISHGGRDFSQWVTYNNGRYRAFLGEARAAVDRLRP
jgi:hypothetical protein